MGCQVHDALPGNVSVLHGPHQHRCSRLLGTAPEEQLELPDLSGVSARHATAIACAWFSSQAQKIEIYAALTERVGLTEVS